VIGAQVTNKADDHPDFVICLQAFPAQQEAGRRNDKDASRFHAKAEAPELRGCRNRRKSDSLYPGL